MLLFHDFISGNLLFEIDNTNFEVKYGRTNREINKIKILPLKFKENIHFWPHSIVKRRKEIKEK